MSTLIMSYVQIVAFLLWISKHVVGAECGLCYVRASVLVMSSLQQHPCFAGGGI